MKIPIIIENSRIPVWLSYCFPGNWFSNRRNQNTFQIYAITLYPFIICRQKLDAITYRHETIHIRQAGELLVLGFYLIYIWDWFWAILKYMQRLENQQNLSEYAYFRIRAEQEAYAHDRDPEYLHHRKPYHWLKNYQI